VNNPFCDALEQANLYLKDLNVPFEKLAFPTGVGFCMALNKKALRQIGFLDEIYEKGYGEENDWCQRAVNAGFFNTVAGNLFVWHQHGGSFNSAEKDALCARHLKILTTRFPQYIRM
jgi:GT2 family glycosyltransferase